MWRNYQRNYFTLPFYSFWLKNFEIQKEHIGHWTDIINEKKQLKITFGTAGNWRKSRHFIWTSLFHQTLWRDMKFSFKWFLFKMATFVQNQFDVTMTSSMEISQTPWWSEETQENVRLYVIEKINKDVSVRVHLSFFFKMTF